MTSKQSSILSITSQFACCSVLLASSALTGKVALANQKIEGCFVAKTDCEALHSIKKLTNPENIRLEPYGLYSVTAQNKVNPSHYQVRIPSIDSSQLSMFRWVPVSCGNYIPSCRLVPSKPGSSSTTAAITIKNPPYLLALSWEPSFCETHPKKTECKTLSANRYDASHLSLHGLWPQPRNNAYCDVDSKTKTIDRRKRWDLL